MSRVRTLLLSLAILLPGLQTATAFAGPAAQALSERTYRQLNRVHELMDKARYPEALASLDRLRARVERRPYEHALVLQTYGHLLARQGEYPRAIDMLEQCLALDSLPDAAGKQSLYLLAQLQLTAGDYPAAANSLDRWFGLEKNPAPAAHALAGSVYAGIRDYPRATKHLQQAIRLARDPDSNWYRQLLAIHYETRQYQAAAALLQQLIARSPEEKTWWLQLSSVQHELGNDSRALSVMKIAWLRGLLTEEAELLNLARYYLYMELPYKAGQLLEQALRDGSIRPDPEHWRLLTNVWANARETGLALAAAERALQGGADANLQLLRARLLAGQEQWQAVIQATRAALATEGLEAPGDAHLLQGIAHYRLQQHSRAKASFERARGFEETRRQAGLWLESLSSNSTLASTAQ